MSNFTTASTRGDVFNAGRDLFNITGNSNTQITFIVTGAVPISAQGLSGGNIAFNLNLGGPSQTNPPLNGLSQDRPSSKLSSTPGSRLSKIASTRIDHIIAMLHIAPPSDDTHRLKLNLHVLKKTISLAILAIQAYESTPLGRNLAKVINPEVDGCIKELQVVLDSMRACQIGLGITRIRSLWSLVWQIGSGDEGLALLMMKLADHQRVLSEALKALNSIAWSDGAGPVSLREFHDALRQGPQSLRHIPTANVHLKDHLGRNIPIAIVFCSSYQDLDFVVQGYCRDRVGKDFIKRGDYQMILPKDGSTIQPSTFASIIKPGMELEMSIVVHQAALPLANDIPKKCPKCECTYPGTADGSWIECRRCSGHIQFSSSAPSRKMLDESHDEDQKDTRLFRRICLILPNRMPIADRRAPQVHTRRQCSHCGWRGTHSPNCPFRFDAYYQ